MTSDIPDKTKQSVNNLYSAIVNKISNLVSIHNSDTNSHPDKAPKNHASSSTDYGISSSQNYGHAKAGGSPQAIGKTLKAGTDNGIYARADHIHTVAYENVSGTPDIPEGSSEATDIQMDGTRAAGSSEKFARANHVHPTDTSRAAASHTHIKNEITDFSHTHGNIQNDGVVKVNGTVQASKNVCTDANGNITTENKNNHSHGSIASGGTLNSDITEVNKIAVTNSSNQLKTISNLPSSKVSEGTALENIGTEADASQHDINDAIDGKISDLQTNKSDITHNHDDTYINDDTGTVTSNNIADGTIVNGDIANTTITGGKLVNETITATQLASNAIETAKIKDANVTTAKIADKNVTTGKLADSAVTTGKIANGTIINEDISSSAAISQSKISNLIDDLTSKNVTLTKLSTPTTGYIATYEVKQGENSLGKIDIPKDYLVKSGTVKTVTTANNPVNGYTVGDKYIDFVINTVGNDGTDSHIYINVKDLIDTYTAGTGLNLSNNEFSVKYGTSSGTACQGNDSRLSNTRTPTDGTVTNAKVASNAAIDFSKLNITKSDIVNLGIPAQDTNTVYTHPSYTARTGKPTSNQTPSFGGTATVSQITSDSTGHVTGATDRTIKIPNTEASTTEAGLMSADDKTKLDGISTGAKNVSVEAKGSGTIEIAQITVDGTTTSIKQRDNNTTYTAASATPNMDGTGAVGTSAKYAREDHVHPTDTSRASTTVTDDLQTQINNITTGITPTDHNHDSQYIKTGTGTVTTTNIANGTIKNEDISTSAAIAQSKINNLTNDLAAKNVTLTKLSTPTNNTYIATYEIKQGETSIGKIDIPKDFLIQSASLEHCTTANTPLEGLNVGDPYIHFVANTNDGTQTAKTIDINVKDLVDTYSAGAGLTLSDNTFRVNFGSSTTTTANYAVGCNDTRLSNTRTPTDNTVTTAKIVDGNVTTAKLADSSITSAKIVDGTIVNGDIANTTIQGGKLVNGTITATQLASNAVETAKIKDANVTTAKIADSNVTTAKIADSAVTSAKIADGTIVNADIANTTITGGKLVNGTITATQLASNAVETAKIKDANITTAKIADNAVTNDKLVATIVPNGTSDTHNSLNNYTERGFYYNGSNSTCTYIDDLPVSGKAFWLFVEDWGTSSKYTKQTVTHYHEAGKTYVRIKNNGTWSAWLDLSKDTNTTYTASTGLTLSGTAFSITNGGVGATQLASNAVETAKIKDANVTTAKIADANVTTAKIADANVTTAKIADSSITSAKIADGTIANGDIANTTIQGGKLVNGTITATQLASNAVETAKIKDANVTTAKIADSNITTAKVADSAITSAKIADKTITNADIADETIDMKKLAVHAYGGTSGTAGYVKLLTIQVTSTYQDRPITFKVERRHATEEVNCSITFMGANNTDPAIGSFVCSNQIGFTGNWNPQIYLYKENTSTWSLIVRKSENYDSVVIRNLLNPCGGITVTQIKEFITTLPSNTTDNPLREIVCLNTVSEYIEGTHGTTATNVWTGTATKIFSLEKGTEIYFKMTSAGTSTAATLNLTLADGTTTGAKNVYYNASTAFTTHLPVNTVLNLVYDGTKWINTAIQNTNTTYTKAANTPPADTTNGTVGTVNKYALENHSHPKSDLYAEASHQHTKSEITDFPTSMAPTSHTHGNITNAGAIGSTANLPIITTTSGKLTTGSFGTAANTFCQGNDSRLSNTRTPTDGSVTNAKVASNAAIDFSKLNITKNDITGLGIPASDTNTTYGADRGISNVSGKFGHSNTAITAGTNYNGNQTPAFGATFNIPKLTYDTYGHITASTNSTVKIPSLPTASTSTAGIIQIGDEASNAAAGNHTHTTLTTGTLTGITTESLSLSSTTTPGWYVVKRLDRFADTPASSSIQYGYLEVKNYSSDTLIQTLYTLNSSAAPEIYYRRKYSSGSFPTTWIKVINSNDTASTSEAGVVQLNNTVTSTSTTEAATANAVKTAYDLANGKPSLGTTASTAAKGNHTHGNITNAGAIGSTANKPIITTTSGKLTTGSFGTTANTFCEGDDSRLSDARTPLAHTHKGWDSKSSSNNWQLYVNSDLGLAFFRYDAGIPGDLSNNATFDILTSGATVTNSPLHGTSFTTQSPYLSAWITAEGYVQVWTSDKSKFSKLVFSGFYLTAA